MDKRRGVRNGKKEEQILDHRIMPHPHIQNGKKNGKGVETMVFSTRRPALEVKGAVKKYGDVLVLHNLNMFAKEGTIYCLVGASNSGKSTILSCITGQKRLTRGELLVFGAKPGSSAAGIPGRRVGFMSQELGLNTELSITQVLQYHGRLNGLTLTKIKERIETLSEVFDMQNLNRSLNKLSPGLQKRASLACALIHEPELIVLDQPTTGMDILFQKGIWMHLHKLVSNGRTSVILSTQNIEESRQAHKVGVLRNGRLLIEDSPQALLQRHGTQLLAEAVAKLIIKDTIRIKKSGTEVVCINDELTTFGIPCGIEDTQTDPNVISSVSYKEWMEQVVHGDEDQLSQLQKDKMARKQVAKKEDLPPYPNPSRVGNRLRALFIKQFNLVARNFWFIFITLLIPFVIITGACFVVGSSLKGLRVGVVNMDFMEGETDKYNATGGFNSANCVYLEGCTDMLLSCRVLDTISTQGFVELEDFETEEEALEELENGGIASLIKIRSGFGTNVFNRVTKDLKNSEEDNYFQIGSSDLKDVFVKQVLKEQLDKALKAFETELKRDCEFREENNELDGNSTEVENSTNFVPREIITQEKESSGYAEFYIPGITILIAYFTQFFTSGQFYLKEKTDGVICRGKVGGINIMEILFIQGIFQFPILLCQTAILVLVPWFILEFQMNIWLWAWYTLLVGCAGFAGISGAFLLSTLFKDVKHIYVIEILALVTSILLSGTIWPREAQHLILQWITYFLPWTLSTSGLRWMVMFGGEGETSFKILEETQVWCAFASLLSWSEGCWFVLCFTLIVRYLRR